MTSLPALASEDYAEWISGLVPHDQSGVVAVLKCGIDESGTHAGSPIMIVAGCVTTTRQWELFAQEWLPQIADREDGYHALSAPPWLNQSLADLMRTRMDYMPVVTVVESEYNEHAPQEFRSTYGAAYTLATIHLVALVTRYCKRRGVNWASYVLASGHKHSKGVDRLFANVLASPRVHRDQRIWSYSWSTRHDPTLHPPDLLSHELGSFGPLGGIFQGMADQHHLGPEEIRHLSELGLEWRRENRRAKTRAKNERRCSR
jgi:hypothetical protein